MYTHTLPKKVGTPTLAECQRRCRHNAFNKMLGFRGNFHHADVDSRTHDTLCSCAVHGSHRCRHRYGRRRRRGRRYRRQRQHQHLTLGVLQTPKRAQNNILGAMLMQNIFCSSYHVFGFFVLLNRRPEIFPEMRSKMWPENIPKKCPENVPEKMRPKMRPKMCPKMCPKMRRKLLKTSNEGFATKNS